METKKISDTQIEIEKVIPEVVIKTTYERSFIEKQIIDIKAQKYVYDLARDAEIKECEDILKAMDELEIGVKKEEIEEVKPIEEPIEPIK